MMYVGIDPGETTGWATFVPGRTPDRYVVGQVHQVHIWDYLETTKFPPGEKPILIVESFRPRWNKAADLAPVEVIGIIKEWAHQNHVKTVFQRPDQAKWFWEDDKIKDMGLWVPGRPHAMDALRHLLYYVYFSNNVSAQDRGQPPTAFKDRLDKLDNDLDRISRRKGP